MKPICAQCKKPIDDKMFHSWVLRSKHRVSKTGRVPTGPFCSKLCYGAFRKERTQRELKIMVDRILSKSRESRQATGA